VGASPAVQQALQQLGISRPSHIQVRPAWCCEGNGGGPVCVCLALHLPGCPASPPPLWLNLLRMDE
jgi:hypothetical protein